MRVKVGSFRHLYFDGHMYGPNDELDIPDESAANWLRTAMVTPIEPMSDAELIALMSEPATEPKPAPPASAPEPVTQAHEECDPGPRPKSARGMQVCPVADCPCLTWKGKCSAHQRTNSATGRRYHDSYRAAPSALRTRWDKASRAYLQRQPYCEDASHQPAITAPRAAVVDHVDGLSLAGPRGFDPENWQALCTACHGRKTAGESFRR
ncbi:HNH endonuclease signature motif containing protein [Streptomyces sp. A475]|uniref:HNH endonuclease n=1 Tax=Streptomyces sp. A475 TaxID=3131976 RepID=UPI0030C972F4